MCFVKGPSEVMSAHVDSVTMAKRSGGNAVELQIFHVQVGRSVGVERGRGQGRDRGKIILYVALDMPGQASPETRDV